MKVGPNTARFFKSLHQYSRNIPKINDLIEKKISIHAFRNLTLQFYQAYARPLVAGVIKEHLVIPGATAGLNVTRYRAQDSQSNGWVLFFAGGGGIMNLGGPIYDWLCSTMAKESGCDTFLIDVRVAPEYDHEDSVQDACAAVMYLYEQALKDQIKNLIVGGNSSGGNLATVVVNGSYKVIPFAGQLLMTPRTDATLGLAKQKKYLRERSQDILMSLKVQEGFSSLYKPKNQSLEHPNMSPYFYKFEDTTGYPKTVLICGECDAFRNDTEAYYEKLIAAGIDARLIVGEGQIHHSSLLYKECPDGIDPVIEAVNAVKGFCGIDVEQTNQIRCGAF